MSDFWNQGQKKEKDCVVSMMADGYYMDRYTKYFLFFWQKTYNLLDNPTYLAIGV